MKAKISNKDLETWADFLLNHSLGGITPDDIVMIKGENITWPLMSVLQNKIFRAGAIADVNVVAPDNDRGRVWGASITRNASVEQIEKTPSWHKDRYDAMTKYIEILGAENPSFFSGLPEEKLKALMKADEPFKNTRLAKPWVLTLFPTQGFAEMEGLKLNEYTDIIVKASTVDPKKLEALEENLFQVMDKGKTVTLITENPKMNKKLELTMNIENRLITKCYGLRNFPDGEVYTSPDANTVEGEVFVDLPVSYTGSTIRGVYLKFEKGVITEYSAMQGYEALRKIIETDEGSQRIGEIAFGMNNGMEKILKHPLFVEKVGGTAHIAIGNSYPQSYVEDSNAEDAQKILDDFAEKGILNKSAQHVDIVIDFRPGGAGREAFIDDVKLEVIDNMWCVPKDGECDQEDSK
ncbi:aminopeptidase [Bacteroidota bacterium]